MWKNGTPSLLSEENAIVGLSKLKSLNADIQWYFHTNTWAISCLVNQNLYNLSPLERGREISPHLPIPQNAKEQHLALHLWPLWIESYKHRDAESPNLSAVFILKLKDFLTYFTNEILAWVIILAFQYIKPEECLGKIFKMEKREKQFTLFTQEL